MITCDRCDRRMTLQSRSDGELSARKCFLCPICGRSAVLEYTDPDEPFGTFRAIKARIESPDWELCDPYDGREAGPG